jgi:hypothetical protein
MNSWKKWKGLITGAALAMIGLAPHYAYGLGLNGSSATLNIDITVNASAAVQIDTLYISSSPGIIWSPGTRLYASGDLGAGIAYASATVKNSGNLTERWYLSTSTNSIDQGSAGAWTLNASSNVADVGPNQFAVQAVFASSATTTGVGTVATSNCPQSGSAGNANMAALWNSTATIVGLSGPVIGDTGNAYGARGGSPTYSNYSDTLQSGAAIVGASTGPDSGNSSGNYAMYSASLGSGFGTRAICWRVILPASTSSGDNQIIPLIVTAQQQ